MWYPPKGAKPVEEADEVSSQAYRIAFRADPVTHYRKMIAALQKRMTKQVKRLGKMAVMIQEPGNIRMAPGLDYVIVEYFLDDGNHNYAVLSHAARSNTYQVEISEFDANEPKFRRLLSDYGCVNMFDLMKDNSFPEAIG